MSNGKNQSRPQNPSETGKDALPRKRITNRQRAIAITVSALVLASIAWAEPVFLGFLPSAGLILLYIVLAILAFLLIRNAFRAAIRNTGLPKLP